MIGLDTRMIDYSGIGATIRGLLGGFSDEQRKRVALYGLDKAPFPVYGLRQHWAFGRMLNRERLSLYHMPHYDVPLSYKGPLVATVHDLIHYLFPQYSTKPFTRTYAWFLLRHMARRASRIIAVSENTKRDLVKLFPAVAPRTVVLHPAVDSDFAPLSSGEAAPILKKYSLEPGYVLYVGNLRESKNTRRLVWAYQAVAAQRPDFPPLVLVGHNSLAGFDPSALGPRVVGVGPVPFKNLPAFYSSASLFVFPSLYEGFGIPPLEAMACGAPTIASNVASIPEVCGDAAEYVDPVSEESIARAMVALFDNPKRREELRGKGFARVKRFSWSSFAQGTWRVYEEVLRESRR